MRRFFISAALAAALLTGCMSEREYQLRSKQLANQAKHPATYDLFTVEGPIKIELAEGGKARVTVPGQPFREIPIPDGVKTQADLISHLVNIGAIGVIGWHAIDKAAGGGSVSGSNNTTTTTTTTYNGGCY